jgi:hypothetical protein
MKFKKFVICFLLIFFVGFVFPPRVVCMNESINVTARNFSLAETAVNLYDTSIRGLYKDCPAMRGVRALYTHSGQWNSFLDNKWARAVCGLFLSFAVANLYPDSHSYEAIFAGVGGVPAAAVGLLCLDEIVLYFLARCHCYTQNQHQAALDSLAVADQSAYDWVNNL